MPLSPELEALLATEKDAAKQATMRKELEDGYRRQADYSRAMNELTKQKKEWQDWHANADKQYKDALAEVKTLQTTVSELEKAKASSTSDDGLSGDDDTALNKALRQARTELEDARKKQSQLEETVAGVNKMISEGKLITAEKFEEELTKRGDMLGAAMFDIIDKQNKCLADYGQPLDRNALIAKAQELKGNLDQAYDILTSPMKEAKLRKDIEAEYEKKHQDWLKTHNLPLDQGGGGEPVLGPLQQSIQKKGTGIPDDVPADGSGRLANLMAAELRAEGKG
jgi:DNA repair exonuclease SbcCD ATPase subunit